MIIQHMSYYITTFDGDCRMWKWYWAGEALDAWKNEGVEVGQWKTWSGWCIWSGSLNSFILCQSIDRMKFIHEVVEVGEVGCSGF